MSPQVVRARAPLRLGLAGGGTDLSPYCDSFGGCVLNVTIGRYAYATIAPRADGQVRFVSTDLRQEDVLPDDGTVPDEGLRLHRGVYRWVMKARQGEPLPGFTLTTSVDCPVGSGLGASSALVVAMLAAFRQWLNLGLDAMALGHAAVEIERDDLDMPGGKQDQFAAAFGGVNFLEFSSNAQVIVNPLTLDPTVAQELEAALLLVFSGASRVSSEIIEQQVAGVDRSDQDSIEATHLLKREALEMKAALLRGDMGKLADILRRGWEAKKRTSKAISTPEIERLYDSAIDAGALAGKISGAGGGGFMMLLVDPASRDVVGRRLLERGADVSGCVFTHGGAASWAAPWHDPACPV
jgi:D-glycero-alpha-D-manno-heptose-7-phosphate kinase